MVSGSQKEKFRVKIATFYQQQRRDFPWRKTRNPYRILVSEIMLQQTQTDRVIAYYRAFLKRFPTVKDLAEASLADVLAAWQGLGYNRRARFLRELAQVVVRDHGGRIPRDPVVLQSLPGIGHYTARAVAVFAFSLPYPMIETNIRAVYIDHFFKDRDDVHDRELLPLIEETIDRNDPREWFYALMDYGSSLKRMNREVTRRSVHYLRQSKFAGSRRQLRGLIIKRLLEGKSLTLSDLRDLKEFDLKTKRAVLDQMAKESIIQQRRGRYVIGEQ